MEALDRLRTSGKVSESVALGPLTTYKFGGLARYIVTVDGIDDLQDAWHIASEHQIPVVALGRGSNVVVSDSGFAGVVLVAGPGLGYRTVGSETVAGAAAPLPLLARDSARAGRGGLEFYTGIPGSVGGAVVMNAGCHGTETSDVLVSAVVFDGVTGAMDVRSPEQLEMSYRHTNLGEESFVIEARFRTISRDPAECEATIREISRWRRDNQPGGTFNAGSVFKNPPGDSAGRIIDSLGLKGLARGAVRVSERHANFFVAEAGAVPADVFKLVMDVQERVSDATGLVLEPEIRFIGSF
jgi:UDP-N-acetylmuramate dehydrogenase